jgi:hypothetical protein
MHTGEMGEIQVFWGLNELSLFKKYLKTDSFEGPIRIYICPLNQQDFGQLYSNEGI